MIFFITVLAAIKFFFFVRQIEDVIESLLDGSDAAGILAVDDVHQPLGQGELLFLHDLAVLDDIDGDGVVDEAKGVKIQKLERSLHLDDVLAAHLAGSGLHDHGDLAVKLVELQLSVDIHGFSGRNMVKYDTFI